MKQVFLVFVLFSSLNVFGQSFWEGRYMLKYEKKRSLDNKGEVKVWKSGDSLYWSFNASIREFWLWESSGYCIEVDSTNLQLFITNHRNYKPKTEARIFKKLERQKPLYVINQANKIFYISTVAGKKKEKLEIIKQ